MCEKERREQERGRAWLELPEERRVEGEGGSKVQRLEEV